jgi:hypothetical protein
MTRAGAISGVLVLVVSVVLVAGGCGRKGPPMVPETRVPAVPDGLAATVTPGAVEVDWTNPSRRVDGSRIRDLADVRLYRHVDGGEGEPKPAIRTGDTVVGYSLLGRIDVQQAQHRPPEASLAGDRVRWVDRAELSPGRRYTYVVTASDSTGRTSAPSQRLSVVYLTAPAPPVGLQGHAGEQQATLSWLAPTTLSDGSPASGAITYQVLRSAGPGAALAPITPTPIGESSYTDTGLENDRTYGYAVVAIRSEAGGVARSSPSATIAVTPRDITPAAPPAGLVAIPSADAVRLSWNSSPEGDVAAYIVYRRGVTGTPVRVGRVSPPGTTFVDHPVPPGHYEYHVTAVDSAALPNESRPSDAVGVDVP